MDSPRTDAPPPPAAPRPTLLARRRRDRRGVALVLVMGALAILAVLLTEFQDETSAELASALADRDSLKAEFIAKSAINLSRLLISTEPTISKAISFIPGLKIPQIPVWEFADQMLGVFNDTQGQQDFVAFTGQPLAEGKHLGLEGGRFKVVIVDEDAKINVNAGARNNSLSERNFAMEFLALTSGDQYRPLFEQRDRDGQFADRVSICQSIADWADSDESLFDCNPFNPAPPSAAAESDAFYQLLKPPYRRKNAAFDSLEELHLVHGVSDDFWATFVDPEPNDPRKRVMTVWGQGAINVNTANAQTLLGVACSGAPKSQLCNDPTQAMSFISVINMMKMLAPGIPLFGSPDDFIATMKGGGQLGPMLKAINVQPVTFEFEAETKKLLSTRSKVFSIYADGIVPGYQRKTRVRIHEVIDFRDAPNPAALPMIAAAGALGGASALAAGASAGAGATAGASASGAAAQFNPFGIPTSMLNQIAAQLGLTNGFGPDGISTAFAPNPGGTVIYHRME